MAAGGSRTIFATAAGRKTPHERTPRHGQARRHAETGPHRCRPDHEPAHRIVRCAKGDDLGNRERQEPQPDDRQPGPPRRRPRAEHPRTPWARPGRAERRPAGRPDDPPRGDRSLALEPAPQLRRGRPRRAGRQHRRQGPAGAAAGAPHAGRRPNPRLPYRRRPAPLAGAGPLAQDQPLAQGPPARSQSPLHRPRYRRRRACRPGLDREYPARRPAAARIGRGPGPRPRARPRDLFGARAGRDDRPPAALRPAAPQAGPRSGRARQDGAGRRRYHLRAGPPAVPGRARGPGRRGRGAARRRRLQPRRHPRAPVRRSAPGRLGPVRRRRIQRRDNRGRRRRGAPLRRSRPVLEAADDRGRGPQGQA